MKAWTRVGVGLLAVTALGAVARGADDDLAVVKRAVAREEKAEDTSRTREAAPKGHRPQWLKIRVVEKAKEGEKKETVAVTVPLSLLAVLADDVSIDLKDLGLEGKVKLGGASKGKVRLGELLDSLESGQTFVEVEEDGSHVRVWVE